jgi:hypothetical protein
MEDMKGILKALIVTLYAGNYVQPTIVVEVGNVQRSACSTTPNPIVK